MTYHPPEYYPHKMEKDEPYFCYLCGDIVSDRSDRDGKSGKGVYDASEGVYHVLHYKCLNYYYECHRWYDAKTLNEIHLISRRNYIDEHYYFNWII